MQALILAGGFGTRLKEVIHDRPKVMAQINGRPFLEYVLEELRRNNVDKVVISVGFLGDFIKNYFRNGQDLGLEIEYSEEKHPLGTGGAIKQAENFFHDVFLIVNGDTHLKTDLQKALAYHREKRAGVTVILVKRRSVHPRGVVSQDKSGRITAFEEKPGQRRGGWVNSGYYIFEPEVLKLIEKGSRISLEREIFPKLAQKELIFGFEVKGDFLDIGTPLGYRRAQVLISQEKRKLIKAWAPARISFAGGGTDLPSYFWKKGGCVVSGTIDKYAHVCIKTTNTSSIRVILEDYQKEEIYPVGKNLPYKKDVFDLYKATINRLRPNLGLEIRVKSDFPPSSGLGTSSAVTVALLGALSRLDSHKVEKKRVADLAIEIERELLKIPGGWQDQYATAYGGFNFIEFLPQGKVKVTSLNVDKQIEKDLMGSLLLFLLPIRRSEEKQQSQFLEKIKKSKKTNEALELLKQLAGKVRQTIENGKITELGGLLHEAWEIKRRANSLVSTRFTDEIYNLARRNGADGGKFLGAGGGGCFIISAPQTERERIVKTLTEKGARFLPFAFEFNGLRTEVYED